MKRPDTPVTARAGFTGAVAAGAALAVLQGLEQVIGAFDPRPVARALVVGAVGLGTFAFERRRARARAFDERDELLRRLDGALRQWPLPRTRDADAYALGVYPPRRRPSASGSQPAVEPYVSRDVDPALEEALANSQVVVVTGPPRSGKTRAALEAARRALPESETVVPRHAEALEELLELGLPFELHSGRALLWLDGLERFIGQIDEETLERLERMEAPVTLVATVRTGEWEELLRSPGQAGEAAKAVAARARSFEVPAGLSPQELREALRLYPEDNLERGIGAALATSGKEQRPPPWRPAEARPEPPPRPSILEDRLVVAPAAASLAALLALGVVGVTVGIPAEDPPSIAAQVVKIKRKATRGGRHTIVSQPVDFHGSGERSYLFAFGDDKPSPGTASAAPARSDEIRVYDRDGDILRERFRFEPRGPVAVYQQRFIGDVDRDGADELIGGYGVPAGPSRAALVPFALNWDDADGRYQLISLHTAPPRLTRRRLSPPATAFRAAYRRRATFVDREGERRLTGYRSQDFAVTPTPPQLVDGYLTELSIPGEHAGILELHPSSFDATSGVPRLIPCRLSERELVATVPEGRLRASVVLDRWVRARRDRPCIPRL